jgi:hypothetical protein
MAMNLQLLYEVSTRGGQVAYVTTHEALIGSVVDVATHGLGVEQADIKSIKLLTTSCIHLENQEKATNLCLNHSIPTP